LSDVPATILLIEDDSQIRRYLRATLPAHGFRLVEAETGREGVSQASSRVPDVVLLDLGLPDLDGLERIREWSALPIIVLSARGLERDKVEALDAGADDYLTKPFGTDELLARIRVALRHGTMAAAEPDTGTFVCGDLRIDLGERSVRVDGRAVHLTPTEFKLLAILVRHAGRVVTHRQLLREVWGPGSVDHTHYLRVQMHSLRQKLEKTPARPEHLCTEPGVGYRLREPSEPS
jgi:two-component system KDP operon response regulator KdpE